MKDVVLRPAAAADVEEAYRWYEERRAGLGEEFLASFETTLNSCLANPNLYPVLHRDTRRALLKRFPYGLYYRVQGERLIVVACFHAKRDPATLRRRG